MIRTNVSQYLFLCAMLCLWGCESMTVFDFDQQLIEDVAAIDNYLADNGIQAQTHPSGLRYEVLEEGSGERATQENPVTIDIAMSRLDGELLPIANGGGRSYSTYRTSLITPFRPTDFQWRALQCLDIAIGLTTLNGRMRLYVPSGLAFSFEGSDYHWRGFQDRPVVEPNTNLIIELQLTSVE